jgi:hypothetical protein
MISKFTSVRLGSGDLVVNGTTTGPAADLAAIDVAVVALERAPGTPEKRLVANVDLLQDPWHTDPHAAVSTDGRAFVVGEKVVLIGAQTENVDAGAPPKPPFIWHGIFEILEPTASGRGEAICSEQVVAVFP